MKAKERRNIKHTLKTNLDLVDTYIKLATTDNLLNIEEEDLREKTKDQRRLIASQLIKLKDIISDDVVNFISEIDNIIEELK